MTNFEKLKTWSVDKWIELGVLPCEFCAYNDNCDYDSDCAEGVRKWLESECDTNDD